MKARTSRQRQRMNRHCFFRVKRRRDRRRRGERRLERGGMREEYQKNKKRSFWNVKFVVGLPRRLQCLNRPYYAWHLLGSTTRSVEASLNGPSNSARSLFIRAMDS